MKQETQQQPGEEGPEAQRPKTRRERIRERTGFGDKTVWDWMQLFIIPAVLVVGGYLLNSQQTARQLATEEQRAENQLEAEEERTQQEALQQYNNEMRSLLLEEDLLNSQRGDAVRELARARTLGVLDNLDPDRKRIIVLFLRETGLASSYGDTIVDLSGADLTNAYLREARLVNTNLGVQGPLTPHVERTDLSSADLSGAILLGANLQAAILEGTDLSGALVGSTDPNLPWHPENADLEGVDLSDADLSGAELVAVDLREADLENASLEGADLSGADMEGATGVTLEELEEQAASLEGATMPDGTEHD